MVSVDAAFRAALTIEGRETLSAIEAALRAFAAPFGYDRFVLFSASSMRGDVVERIYWVEADRFGDGKAVDAGLDRRRPAAGRYCRNARRVGADRREPPAPGAPPPRSRDHRPSHQSRHSQRRYRA